MRRRKTAPPGGGASRGDATTTAAGLGRKVGRHRGNISRMAKKLGLSTKRFGHYLKLSATDQAQIRKRLRK